MSKTLCISITKILITSTEMYKWNEEKEKKNNNIIVRQ